MANYLTDRKLTQTCRLMLVPLVLSLVTGCLTDDEYITGLGHPELHSDVGVGSIINENPNIGDFAVADPNANALFPGSIVQGNSVLQANGMLSPIQLARTGGTLTVTGATVTDPAGPNYHVNETTLPTVTQGLKSLLTRSLLSDQSGVISEDTQVVYSSNHARWTAGIYVNAYSTEFSSFFNEVNDVTQNHVLFSFSQRYFSVAYTPDQQKDTGPARFFSHSVGVDDLKPLMYSNNPPLLISSIAYGRQLYFLASSTASTNDMKLAFSAATSWIGGNASGSLSIHQRDVINSSTVKVLAIGGRASDKPVILTNFAGGDVLQALANYVASDLDFSAHGDPSRALPIDYTLSYLDDGNPAKCSSVVKYNPNAVSTATITSVDVLFHVCDNDKEKEDKATLTIFAPDGQKLCYNEGSSGNGDSNQYWEFQHRDHWNNGQTVSSPLALYDVNSCKAVFDGSGCCSWTATVTAWGHASDGKTYLLLRKGDDSAQGEIPFNEGHPGSYTYSLHLGPPQ